MRKGSCISLSLCFLSFFLLAPLPGYAQTKYPFDLPEQPLAESLRAVGRQTSTNVMFEPRLVKGLAAPALRTRTTTVGAIRLLIAGTKLVMLQTAADTILIQGSRNDGKSQSDRQATSPTSSTSGRNTRFAQVETGSSQASSSSDASAEASEFPGRQRVELEEIVVTGSHIRNATPTSTVITIGREEIERGGYTSVQEVFRQVPQNFASTTPVTGGSNLGETTQIDLRGFGSKSTLTLVNGRRVSVAAGDRGRAVDISMIPLAAVERIEILTDGASALYGSDAIGGVTNLLLRKDFTGWETSVQYGDNTTASDDLFVAQMVGASWDTGRILAAAQYRSNDALTFHEIGIDTFDFRPRGGSDQRVVGLGNATTNGTVFPALGVFVTPGMPPGTFSATLPTGDGRSLTTDQLGINEISAGDYSLADLAPEERDSSGYILLEQDIGPVTVFVDGVYGRRRSTVDQGFLYTQFAVPAGCAPTGATANCNPFSPFAEPVFVLNRLNEFGRVTNDVERDGWAGNVGARGRMRRSDWTWEVSGTFSEDESATTIPFSGQPQPAELQSRLANPDPALAFNPFGDGTQSPGVVDALQMPTRTQGRTTLGGGSVLTQGTLWQMSGGAVRLALGADYREEELKERQTQLGGVPLVSTSFGVAVDGSRDLRALFGELYFPLVSEANARPGLRELAFSAAARYEEYSDFGETTNPKLGIVWQPFEDLALKANWGTSFRAPSLIELHATVFERQASIFDPNRPAGTPPLVPVTQRQGGNADLQEETAQTYTIAGEYRPRWLERARLSLNYFHTVYKDRIRGSLDGLGRNALFQFEDSLPPGIIVRDANGVLQSIFITNLNSARTIASGYDMVAGYYWDTVRHGGFDLSAAATFYTRFDDRLAEGAPTIDLLDKVGNVPDWRGRMSLSWSSGPWGATVSGNYTDDMWNAGIAQTPLVLREVDSQITVDAQLSFTSVSQSGWLQGITVLLGASNLFDERPPFVDGANGGLDARNATIEGRTVYVRLRKGFGSAAR